MKLSIIITTYNRPQMLRQTIESVVGQGLCDKEIIVVDDNSTMDNSFCIPMVDKYIKNSTNQGLGQNHIIGFRASEGDYICFMDDDDFYTDYSYYEKAVNLLDGDESLLFVSASSTTLYEPSGKTEPYVIRHGHHISSVEYLQHIMIDYKKPQSTFTTVFRRKTLTAVGLENMINPEDAALYLRTLTADGYVCLLEDQVGMYRIHSSNMSKSLPCLQMIELLEEQNEVYVRAKRKLKTPLLWWYKQYRFTFDFVLGSGAPKKTLSRLARWGMCHMHFSPYIPLFLLKYKLTCRY